MLFFQSISSAEDIYLATRLLMMFYWLSLPVIGLLLIGASYVFPKINWVKTFPRLEKLSFYWKNLSILGLIILLITVAINTLLLFFYFLDAWLFNNHDKYVVYWQVRWVNRPILSFFLIIVLGYILYWIFAIICYKKYWNNYFNFNMKIFSRY
ncbi:hypothetical protein [Mycoplasma parvum]|uniref:Uncharacterized protein n=1 Tax=Mycoplasma parvum str. Indiana TaxID=1403316 RepID=U5NBR6_9MOLU|nr:hypothetical protein [Mycoplasma parvum]AGX89006.1 hypothetical protein PRV_01220 [Mycoplasma parvum str. Indiana]